MVRRRSRPTRPPPPPRPWADNSLLSARPYYTRCAPRVLLRLSVGRGGRTRGKAGKDDGGQRWDPLERPSRIADHVVMRATRTRQRPEPEEQFPPARSRLEAGTLGDRGKR